MIRSDVVMMNFRIQLILLKNVFPQKAKYFRRSSLQELKSKKRIMGTKRISDLTKSSFNLYLKILLSRYQKREAKSRMDITNAS